MDTILYATAKANFAATMKRVCQHHEPVIVARSNAESVVMLSLADYNSMKETAHLFGTIKNTRRLLDSIRQLDAGKVG